MNTTRDGHQPIDTLPARKSVPSSLNEDGKKFFNEIFDTAKKWGVLAKSDLTALTLGAEAYQNYRRLMNEGEIDKAGKWFDKVMRMLSQFGFTPSSREAVSKVLEQDQDKDLFND